MSLNIDAIRKEFPILGTKVYDKPLIYLDNAATTQKPLRVLEVMDEYYRSINSNIHRGIYAISVEATEQYEASRERVREFLNAAESREIIFTRGTTEAINLAAFSFSEKYLSEGDEVLVTGMEHHSNIVPWQMACQRKKATLKVVPLTENGELQMDQLESMLGPKTCILALTHVSNVTGGPNPVKEIIRKAHAKNIPVLLDGAQAAPHIDIDVQDLDCDFYAFSGHKVYGPMGVGVLYGKASLLEAIPPWQGGGEMIDEVSFDKTTYNDIPYKFEAGTSAVASALGLKAALDYITDLGTANIHEHEKQLLDYARIKLNAIPGLKIYGDRPDNLGVLSFLVEGIHPYDLGTILDKFGVAMRTGNHCAQPLMDFWGIPGTMRASLGLYNNEEDIDHFTEALKKAIQIFI